MKKDAYYNSVVGENECVTGVVLEETSGYGSGEELKARLRYYEKTRGKGSNKMITGQEDIAEDILIDICDAKDMNEFIKEIRGIISEWRKKRGQSGMNVKFHIRNDFLPNYFDD